MNTRQSKVLSLIESIVNVIVGLVISFLTQSFIFGIYDIHLSLISNITITLFFTFISVLRSYIIRRLFNCNFHHRVLNFYFTEKGHG
jgi:hypothetical protein